MSRKGVEYVESLDSRQQNLSSFVTLSSNFYYLNVKSRLFAFVHGYLLYAFIFNSSHTDLISLISRHGEPWKEFRSRVQKPVLQPKTVRKYITPIEVVTEDFITR